MTLGSQHRVSFNAESELLSGMAGHLHQGEDFNHRAKDYFMKLIKKSTQSFTSAT